MPFYQDSQRIGSKGRMMTKFSTRDIVVLNGNVIDSHYPHIVEKFTVKQLKGELDLAGWSTKGKKKSTIVDRVCQLRKGCRNVGFHRVWVSAEDMKDSPDPLIVARFTVEQLKDELKRGRWCASGKNKSTIVDRVVKLRAWKRQLNVHMQTRSHAMDVMCPPNGQIESTDREGGGGSAPVTTCARSPAQQDDDDAKDHEKEGYQKNHKKNDVKDDATSKKHDPKEVREVMAYPARSVRKVLKYLKFMKETDANYQQVLKKKKNDAKNARETKDYQKIPEKENIEKKNGGEQMEKKQKTSSSEPGGEQHIYLAATLAFRQAMEVALDFEQKAGTLSPEVLKFKEVLEALKQLNGASRPI